MDAKSIQKKLAEPFDPTEVKFKPQMVKNNRALAMAYIDARLVQERLDEVVGLGNWQDRFKILNDGSVVCRLSVKIDDKWVTKTDVGSLSEQPDAGDRLKAAFSDALKRAAVKFGIGRYLYGLAAQWVDYDAVKKQLTQLPQLPEWAIPKKLATPQQVYQLEGLLDEARIPEAEWKAWLDKAVAEEWADLTQQQIVKAIDHCKKQIAAPRK